VTEPDKLLDFLGSIAKHYIVISTPDRDLVYQPGDSRLNGPPGNTTHMREWTFDELRKFVESKFEIVDHIISNRRQATQMIVCRSGTGS
jgi:hypothetical protein